MKNLIKKSTILIIALIFILGLIPSIELMRGTKVIF